MAQKKMSDYYESSPIDFSYYWRILKSAVRASYWQVGLISLLVGTLAYFYSLSLTPEYRATATLHVAPEKTAVFNLRELLLDRRDPAFQQTQVGIIQSRSLIEQVVRKHELHKNELLFAAEEGRSLGAELFRFFRKDKEQTDSSEQQSIRSTTQIISESITVKARDKSYLVTLSVALPDPGLAAQVANSLADFYVDSVYESKRLSVDRSESWLLDRLQTVKDELQEAEQSLQSFKEKENIIGSSQQNSGLVTQEIDQLSSRLIEAREARLALEAIYQQIISIERASGDLQSIGVVEENALIQNIRSELLQLEQRKSELSKRYGPEHRKMIAVDSEITAATRNLDQQTNRVITGVKADYDLAKENEAFIERSLEQSTGKVQSFGRKQFELLALEQNVATQREVYNAFLERLNQSRATGDNVDTSVRVTDPAISPLRPESSKGGILVVLAVILSAGFGFFIALLRELFDNTLITQNDIEKKLGVQTLGVVPKITEVEPTDDKPNVAHEYFVINKYSQYAESIRTLRSSLMLSSINQAKVRLMFTSTQPSEGKTSLAISTAAAFGQVRKTLLIDGDLRRPSILGAIGDSHQKTLSLGLSDLCIGVASEEDCIHHIEKFGFDVVTSGTITPNPQELFCSTNFSLVMNRLSEIYEVIVIDSPPAGGLSDAHLLAAQVDELVYVVKAGETAVNRVRATIRSLLDNNAPVKGIVLNQADQEISDYGYSYYSAYGVKPDIEGPGNEQSAA